MRHAAGASAGGLGMGEGRLHLKIELVVGPPAPLESDLEAGLEEADVDAKEVGCALDSPDSGRSIDI